MIKLFLKLIELRSNLKKVQIYLFYAIKFFYKLNKNYCDLNRPSNNIGYDMNM